MELSDNIIYHRGMDMEEEHNDIWDDTALIKAYEKAVNLVKVEEIASRNEAPEMGKKDRIIGTKKRHKKKKKQTTNYQNKWQLGDLCQSVYSEDGLYYDAQIESINNEAGSCVIKYLGYGNTEEVPLTALKPLKLEKENTVSESESSTHVIQDGDWREDDDSTTSQSFVADTRSHFSSHSCLSWYPPPPPLPPPPLLPPPFHHQHALSWPPFPPQKFAGMPPPPLPPLDMSDETLASMLMSWYMSGYHTGYYQALHQRKSGSEGRQAHSSKMKF